MAKSDGKNNCLGCIWNDVCGFTGPCQHYTPDNYEDMLDARDIQAERARYNDEWQEYIEYCREEYD